MEPVVKYHCPVCDKEYDTPEEAEKCFVPLYEKFKNGDIISGGYNSVYVVKDAEERNAAAATVREVFEYCIATDSLRRKRERCVLVGGFWCGAKRYPLEEAKKLVSDLRRRLKNAEKFLEMVKEMYEEDKV